MDGKMRFFLILLIVAGQPSARSLRCTDKTRWGFWKVTRSVSVSMQWYSHVLLQMVPECVSTCGVLV